jgi:Uma2 family endonuclease
METLELISPTDYERERGKPMPTLQHALIQQNLVFEIKTRYRHLYHALPELTLEMPEKPDSVPDVAIYPVAQIRFENEVIRMNQMPLTTIEILSPSQRDDELISKTDRYFQVGVKSCWIVLPGFRAVAVYSGPRQYQFFMEDSTLVDPVTGIELAVSELFR